MEGKSYPNSKKIISNLNSSTALHFKLLLSNCA